MEEYKITEKFLDDILTKTSRILVGIVCKRFEILENKEDIKKSVKELIYENARNIKALIKSFDSGVKFESKPKEEK